MKSKKNTENNNTTMGEYTAYALVAGAVASWWFSSVIPLCIVFISFAALLGFASGAF